MDDVRRHPLQSERVMFCHLRFTEELPSEKICDRHLSCWDQEAILISHQMISLEQIILKFRQLTRAFKRAPGNKQRNRHLRISVIISASIEKAQLVPLRKERRQR